MDLSEQRLLLPALENDRSPVAEPGAACRPTPENNLSNLPNGRIAKEMAPALAEAPVPTLVYSPHPLLPAADRRVEYAHFFPGETITEYLDRAEIVLHGPAVLRLNGRFVPRAMWAKTRPKPGMMLTIRADVAGGGGDGNKMLRTVLMVALMVVGNVYGLGVGQAMLSTGYAAGTYAAVGQAAIMIGGSILINGLVPPPKPILAQAQQRGSQPSPTYAISGGSNRARPYEPLPLLLGQHRFFPDVGAKEYTEFEGDDQFLYECYHFGLGDLLLTDFRIGDTPITSYADVQMEIAGADGKLALFPQDVSTIEGGLLAPDTPVQRTSSLDSTGLAVEIVGALYRFSADGAGPLSVEVRMEYRLVGASAWLPFAGDPVTITNASTKPVRLTYKIDVPAGQYEVRIERTTDAYTADTDAAQLEWSQLRSYKPDTTDYTGQNRVALKIRATGQISGRVDRFSALGSMRCLAWDGVDTWTKIETSNPAWLFLYVARGGFIDGRKAFGAGLADSRIDIAGLKAFGAWCAAKNLSFNGVADRPGMSSQALLDAIALCGRGSLSWASGKLGVVWDAPDQPVSAVYGMGNIVASTMRMQYITEAVAQEIVTYFVNPDLDWQQDFVRAVVPGTVGTPTRTVRMDLWGCTDRDMAGQQANLWAADQYFHNARLNLETDIEGFVNTRGDTILLAHDLMRTNWGYSGRLIEGSTASTLCLGRKVPFTETQSHYVLVKKPDGSFGIHPVTYQAGESDTLTLVTPLAFNPSADADGHPVYDYVWMFDLRPTPGRRVKIIDIPKVSSTRVTLVCVDDTPDYYTAETGDYIYVPATPAGNNAPVLTNLVASEELVLVGSAWLTRVTLTWDVESGRYDHAIVRVGINGSPLEERGQTPGRRFDLDVPVGSVLEIAVAGVHPLGYVSPAILGSHTVAGQVTAPAAPTALNATGGMFQVSLVWGMDLVSRRDIRHTEIWASNTNDRTLAARITCAPWPEQRYNHVGLAPAQQWYYWVRLEDTSLNFSTWYPANAAGGVPGMPSADPSALLTQLMDSVGLAQLATELAEPIALVPVVRANQLWDELNAEMQAAGKWALLTGERVLASAQVATEQVARETAVAANVADILANAAAISETASEAAAALLAEAAARAGGLSVLQTQMDTLAAASSGDLSDLIAAIATEATARVDGDAAEAAQRDTLAAQMRGTNTGTDLASLTQGLLYSERVARADADTAEAVLRVALAATVTGNDTAQSAALTTEQTARANGDVAVAATVTTLSSQVNNVTTGLPAAHAAVVAEQVARASGDTANANSITALTSQVNNVTTGLPAAQAAIATEMTTRASGDAALTNSFSTLSAQVNNATSGLPAAQAAIVAEQTTRAGADSGIAATVTTLSAQVNNGITGLPAAHAAIVTEATTRANADTANASTSSTVQARLDTGDYAAVKAQSTASVGRLGVIEAKHVVKVDVNGHVSGIELISDGSVGSMVLLADKLLWVMPDGSGAPKQILVGGAVGGVATLGLAGNLIIDGSIVARSLALNTITAASGVIADLAITTAKIVSVDAAKVSATSLAAVSAVLGDVHAGSVDIDSAGFVKSGQSGYDAGTGFWFGMSGGVPKVSLGSATKGFVWDGAALTVRGNIIASGNIVDGSVTNRFDDSTTTDINIATDSAVWTDIISGPITSTGKPIDVSFNVDFALQVASGQQFFKVRILRGVTAIYDPGTFLAVNGGLSTYWTRTVTDKSAAGTYIFKVQAQRSPAGVGVKTTEQSVTLMELKK